MTGYDHIAEALLQLADPKVVTRKDDLFELRLPVDADILAIAAMLRRELLRFPGATLFSASFDRSTDRTAEFWIEIPSDPMGVRLGSYTYEEATK